MLAFVDSQNIARVFCSFAVGFPVYQALAHTETGETEGKTRRLYKTFRMTNLS
jgi:hypothetical protein